MNDSDEWNVVEVIFPRDIQLLLNSEDLKITFEPDNEILQNPFSLS